MMEKALKILNRLKEQIVDSYTQPYNVEISYTEDFESDIVQAIGELEEAMKPKECSKCKHIHQGWWCNENGIRVTLDFCCNRYEAKDNNETNI